MKAAYNPEAVGTTYDVEVLPLIQQRTENLYAAINPRSVVELEFETLIPEIIASKGVITKALVCWQVPEDDPIWESGEIVNTLTNEPVLVPLKDRKKSLIICQGHRRQRSAAECLANPDQYPSTVIENLRKLPCIPMRGSREVMERIALDDEGSRPLHSWDTVRIVCQKLSRDIPWREIVVEMPQLLCKALLKNGGNRFDEMARIPDGTERLSKMKTALRNPMENHILSAHLFGRDVMVQQLILHFRYKENKRPDAGDQNLLVLDMKYKKVLELRKLYNKLTKDEGQSWRQVTKVAREDKPEKGENTSCKPAPGGGYFVVTGGLSAFRETLLKEMHLFARPEDAETVTGPKPPTKSDKENAEQSSTSNVGRATAQYLNRGTVELIDGKTRSEWDHNAAFCEEVQKALNGLENLQPLVAAAVTSIVATSHPDVGAQKAIAAFEALNKALTPIAKN